MRRTQKHKLLRISTFLAVSVGLAMGTSVAAAPPADEADTTKWAEYDGGEHADEPMVDEDERVQLREDVDFPGDIEDFAEFLQEHQEEGIENVPEYTHQGAERMADAMEEVIPGDEGLFQDRPEEYQVFDDRLDQWEERVDELSDYEREDFAQIATDVLNEGAQWLTDLQEQAYPDLGEQVQAVQTAADELDSDTNIDEQGEQVEQYFIAALGAIEEMYVTHEEDPLATVSPQTLTPVVDTGSYYAQADYEDDPMRDDPMMEQEDPLQEEPERAEAVQNYIDHVEGLEEGELEGEQGQQNVVTTFNHLEEALGTFIEEEEPVMEPAEYDGMEEPGIEDEPVDELTRHHEELRNNIDQLEQYVGEEEFSQYLTETADTATQLLTNIQMEQFPELEDEIHEIREAAGQLDPNVEFDEQTSEIMSYFDATKDALEAMEEEPEPVVLRF